MKPTSFRFRLALWYTVILAVVQIVFAVTLGVTVWQSDLRKFDRDLLELATAALHGPPPPPPPGRRPPNLPPRWVPAGQVWSAFDPDAARTPPRGPRARTIRYEGEPMRVLTLPWPRDEPIGVMQTARPLGEQARLMAGLTRSALVLLPLSLLLAMGGGLLLTDRALRPLRQVTHAAAELGAEDLSRRLPVTGHDELAELAQTFNGMLGRLETAFEQQRRFTADASHELRTPLTRIKAATSLALSDGGTPADDRAALVVADQAADAMTRLIDALLVLARADAGQLGLELRRVEVGGLLEQALALLPTEAAARVTLRPPKEPLAVRGDLDHLARVLVNLLQNALRHTPKDGTVLLTARAQGVSVRLSVQDNGEGIAPQHLRYVTERFYRVDPARTRKQGGTGLGLSICRSLVEAHDGRLELRSAPGKGTTATVSLPAVR